jgi:hypothetical protein
MKDSEQVYDSTTNMMNDQEAPELLRQWAAEVRVLQGCSVRGPVLHIVEAIALIKFSNYWDSILDKIERFRNGDDNESPDDTKHIAKYLKLEEEPLKNGETYVQRAKSTLYTQLKIGKEKVTKYLKIANIPKSLVPRPNLRQGRLNNITVPRNIIVSSRIVCFSKGRALRPWQCRSI